MALARSASGPGGLSINTGSANLFGNSTGQLPAAGGLFGASTATQQPAQSGTSLFGASSQPQNTGSLFGTATSTQQPQQQSGGFFGNSTTTQQNTTQQQQQQQQQPGTGGMSLFGQSTAAQPGTGGGLFGTGTQQQQPQQTGGGLFGNTQQQQQQTTTGGGLFGSTQPQQQQQTGGGLFGNTQPQQQQQQMGGGLFGSTTTQQPAQTGGLFGASTAQQQQPQTGGGLFGASTANTGGMFGAKPATTMTGGGLFGTLGQSTAQQQQQQQQQQPQQVGLTMGQSTTQQPQTVPGVRIDVSNIRSTTRFNDLQEDLQKHIAFLDDNIQKCIKDKEAVDAFLPAHGEQLAQIPVDVSFVARKYEGAHDALADDVQAVHQLRDTVRADADNAKLSFKAVDNLRLPTQYHQAGLWSTRAAGGAGHHQGGAGVPGSGSAADADAESNSDLITYFSKTADEMDEMMRRFEGNLGEIEVHLHGVQGNMLEQLQRVSAQQARNNATNGAGPNGQQQNGVDDRVVELAMVLRDFEESILKVAGVVGGVKEGITELQLKDFMGHQ